MARPIPQLSFGGGVLSPQTYSRIDLQKFGSGFKQGDNYFVEAEGGLSNRGGFKFISPIQSNTDTARLITFEFNESQAYALLFGDLYMRLYSNGGLVLEANQTITGITAANPAVVTVTGHPFANGDEVYLNSVVGMIEVNARYFTVANATANTFELSGTDSSAYTAYSSAGTAARVYEIATPYAHGELAELKFRQSNDVIYMGHTSHAPRKLSRLGATNWTLTEVTFEPTQTFPTGVTVAPQGTTGSTTYNYIVTAVAEETAEESLSGTGTTQAITGATQANPVVLTVTSHPFANGQQVHISGISGMTELNGRRFTVANQATNTIELSGENGTGHTAYTSGGSADRTIGITTTGNATLNTTNYNQITFTAAADAEKYNIYKDDNGLYGYLGTTESLTFDDKGLEADLNDTAPKLRQPFGGTDNYPEAVGLHEQRTWWGGSVNKPLTVWSSQTGQFENTNVSSPTKATDAITVRLVTGKGNEIRHFVSFDDQLFVFTSGAVWTIGPGGDADAITPASKLLRVQEYLASTQVAPLTIKKNMLMVAGKANQGFEVHSIGEDIQSGIAGNYVGSDLTVLSRNLFEQFTIVEWCYLERPHRVVLAVRSDGKILCMTYLNEHQIYAWTLWETDGLFESICSVPEGQDDYAYAVVMRTIDGVNAKYVERLEPRDFTNIEDAKFLDSWLTYDGTNAVTISGATAADPVVITATGHPYENGDKVYISDVAGMTEINEREFTVANKATNTFELSGEDGSAHTAYSSAGEAQLLLYSTSTVLNLDHLEAETTVVALLDGNIEDGLTCTGGAITTANGFIKITVGMPYTATFESLPTNVVKEVISKRKKIHGAIIRVKDTRGIYAGTSLDNMQEYPSRELEVWGDPAATVTDVIRLNVPSDWKRDTSVFIQSEPGLPQTILSVVPDVTEGGG